MHIFVDADACPMTHVIIELAETYHLAVTLVKSYDHFSTATYPKHVSTVYVDHGPDAADFEIVKRCSKGDLVITQDYGLASLCLNKNCIVMHHKGFVYTHDNIDRLLYVRHMNKQARSRGERIKGPSALKKSDEEKFHQALKEVILNNIS